MEKESTKKLSNFPKVTELEFEPRLVWITVLLIIILSEVIQPFWTYLRIFSHFTPKNNGKQIGTLFLNPITVQLELLVEAK